MKATIICIGNRFVAADAAGPAVYDRLQQLALPEHVEVIDGGLQGLNLLPLLERGGRVVFVDAVRGFAEPGTVVVLEGTDVAVGEGLEHFGHEAGLGYLLTVLPKVCDGVLPEEIALVGIEGAWSPSLIDRAAGISVRLAVNGLQEYR